MAAFLHHLQLTSPNPERLARFYEATLDMERIELGEGRLLCAAEERKLLFARGPAKHLDFAAYAFEERAQLAELKKRLESRTMSLLASPSPLFGASAFSVLDPAGNRLVFGHIDDLALGKSNQRSSALPGRLQHLVVASRQCAVMTRFYSDVLGYAISDRVLNEKNELTTCFLRSSNEHHSFAVFQAPHSGLDHYCFETGDWGRIRDWADRLAAQNIMIEWGPGRHGPGNNLFIFIHDPDGNFVEFSAELEVVAPDRPAGSWPHSERTLNVWGRALLRA